MNKPLLLNGLGINGTALNQAPSAGSVGYPAVLNGNNVTYVNLPAPSQFQQPFPILSNLLQPKQEVPSTGAPNTAQNTSKKNVSHVDQEHDYNKKLVTEETHKGNVFLTINLTKYTKGINVNDICGVVLLLKGSAPPVVVNNINIQQQATQQTEDIAENTTVVPPNEPATVSNNAKKNKTEDAEYIECAHCDGGFFSKSVYKNHLRRNHGELKKRYKCLPCKKSYVSQKHLRRHRELVHFHWCDYCDDSFEHALDFKMHIKEKHPEVLYRMCKPFYCEYCNKELEVNKTDYLKHLRTHGNAICGVCAEGYPTKKELKVHMEIHPDEFFCGKCNKGFKLKETLKAHEDTHNNPYSFVCPICKRGFKTKLPLNKHIDYVHMNKERNYMCEICSKMFSNPHHLDKHQKVVHEGRRDYKCPHCDKCFSNSSTVKMHIDVMHSEEKPYQCEYCGKRFARKDYVMNHSKIHQKTGDEKSRRRSKPPSLDCVVCGKTLASYMTLRNHLKNVHKMVRKRRFKCRHCDLTFVHKLMKMRHERLHRDPANKFQCPICLIQLEKEEELKAHLEGHENDHSFVCTVCEEMFASTPLLTAHVEAEHSKEAESANKSGKDKTSPSFHCTVCGKIFSQAIVLKTHLKNVHKVVSRRRFKCRHCDLTFIDVSMKLRHEELHNDPANEFQCPVCQVLTENEEDLRTHLEGHENPNDLFCAVCEESFVSIPLLVAHVEAEHGKELESTAKSGKGKPSFDCQVCDKSFASLISLSRHLKNVHNIVNTVRFKCRRCDLTFTCHEMKMKHERLHGDPVNRFQCPICEIRMENKEGLRTHLAEHEDEDPSDLVCMVCDKAFSSRFLLTAHLNSEHLTEEVNGEDIKLECDEMYDDEIV